MHGLNVPTEALVSEMTHCRPLYRIGKINPILNEGRMLMVHTIFKNLAPLWPRARRAAARVALLALGLMGCNGIEVAPSGSSQSESASSQSSSISTSPLALSDIEHALSTSQTWTASAGTAYSSVSVDLGADFTASNICGTKSIFGRTGAAVCQNSPAGTGASAADVLAGTFFWNSSGVSTQGTMAAQILSASSETLSAGYYSTEQLSSVDGDLSSNNIRAGVTVFGIIGNSNVVNTSSGNAVGSDLLIGRKSWVDGSEVTGSMINRGNWDLTGSFAGEGYYSSVSNAPSADEICSGSSVVGVSGDFDCTLEVTLASNQYRDPASAQVSQKSETVLAAATAYTNSTSGYRAIPNVSKDDDGVVSSSNATLVNRTSWDSACDAGSGATGGSANSACKCGQSGTLVDRIADCASHGTLGANATWDGATKANSGQGAWKLVTRTGATSATKGREVWQDQRTQLLWSSLVATSINWCRATGSNSIPGNPGMSDDPNGICASSTYQNPTGTADSACFEDSSYFDHETGTIDPEGKGGLGSESVPTVGWRTPTVNDYHQAVVNGVQFVLPDTSASAWTATVSSLLSGYAWTVSLQLGAFTATTARTTNTAVRCVGR